MGKDIGNKEYIFETQFYFLKATGMFLGNQIQTIAIHK